MSQEDARQLRPNLELIDHRRRQYRYETGRAAIADPIYRQFYCLAYNATPHDLFGAFEAVEDNRDHFVVRTHKFHSDVYRRRCYGTSGCGRRRRSRRFAN